MGASLLTEYHKDPVYALFYVAPYAVKCVTRYAILVTVKLEVCSVMPNAFARVEERLTELEGQIRQLEGKEDDLSRRERVALREEKVLLMQAQGMHRCIR